VVHEDDFAPDWKDPWAQPGPILWLCGGKAIKAYARAGVDTSILYPSVVAAHSIDGQYIPALDAASTAGRADARRTGRRPDRLGGAVRPSAQHVQTSRLQLAG
jgi:hypothetical protein